MSESKSPNAGRLRKAAEQAVHALEDGYGTVAYRLDAIHALKAALAEPEHYDAARRTVTLTDTKTGRRVIPIGRIAGKLLDRPPFVVQPNEASTLFAKLTRRLLIDGVTFHDARATALTHLARRVDVLTLARVSGHKDLALLNAVYYRESSADVALRLR